MLRPGLSSLDRLSDRMGLPDLPRLPWVNQPIRPAEVSSGLRDAMLARENMLEDVNYQKVVPNRFVVEVSEDNYNRQFRPIEPQIVTQWRDHLLEELLTANSRQGRKEFRFGGRLRFEVRPAPDLKDSEARILSKVEPDVEPPRPQVDVPASARPRVPAPRSPSRPSAPPHRDPARSVAPMAAGAGQATVPGGPVQPDIVSAFLELLPTGQRWALYPGFNTIGRSDSCQVYLDMPVVQEKRLVSGQHAFIVMERGECTLFDGAPDGRPSANGTYVNLRRVPPGGYRLQNGDAIVLAAIDPLYPRSDTPGVVTFYFWASRRT